MTEEVRSEVAGTVFELLVRAGDTAAEGDVLLVLESMKMEISVHAPHAGVIAELCVAEGDVVSAGQILVRLRP